MMRQRALASTAGVLGALAATAWIALARAEEPDLPEQCAAFRETKHTRLTGVYGTYDWRHSWYATSVTFTPDGSRAISASGDGSILTWDPATGRELAALRERSGVSSIAVSPDGRRLLVGAMSGAIRVWDLEKRAPVATWIEKGDRAVCVAWSADGDRALAAVGSSVVVFDGKSGQRSRTLSGVEGPVHAAAFAPDGSSVLAGGDEGSLVLWRIEDGAKVRSFVGHAKKVLAVAFTPDGKRALTGGEDCTLRTWNVADGSQLEKVDTDAHGFMHPWSMAVLPGGERLVCTFGNYGVVAVYDLAKMTKVLEMTAPYTAVGVAVSPDGAKALTADMRGLLSLWDLRTGARLNPTPGHITRALGVSVSPDAELAVTAGEDARLCVWNLAEPAGRTPSKTIELGATYMEATSVAFVGTRSLFWAGQEGTLSVIDIATGEVLKKWKRGMAGHGEAAIAHGRVAQTFGKTLVLHDFGDGDDVKIEDAHGGEPVRAVALSRDGKTAISGGDDRALRAWDVLAREEIPERKIATPEPITAVAFVPGAERTIIAGGAGGMLTVYDVKKGEAKRALVGHTSGIMAIAVSSDGRRAFTSSRDETVRIWDLATGAERDRIDLGGSSDQGRGLALTPDERTLLVSTSRGVLLRFALE